MSTVYLALESGLIFEGESFGAECEAVGELVFTTGIAGYIEMLSDPCYYGQIVLTTFPQLGNYGMNSEDIKSAACRAKGVVVREWCDTPSNFRSEETVDSYLKRNGVPGVCGVDTRELTRVIRELGVQNALITPIRPDGIPDTVKNYKTQNAVAITSIKERLTLIPEGETSQHIAVIDLGASKSIIDELLRFGSRVTVFPYNTGADEVLATHPDGVVLSNGPGDPSENTQCVNQIKAVLGKLPLLGIGLGHQILALAAGAKILKLKYGHRGCNQPVRELSTGRVFITTQNHGYAVDLSSIGGTAARLSYINLNDGSCEGLIYPGLLAFSLQFNPESNSKMGMTVDSFIHTVRGDTYAS